MDSIEILLNKIVPEIISKSLKVCPSLKTGVAQKEEDQFGDKWFLPNTVYSFCSPSCYFRDNPHLPGDNHPSY